ncbi:MAG: hypothetical protein IKT40_03775 [Bacilli bacterium]|nr:hypothetical protein [Bacilli bacterium]
MEENIKQKQVEQVVEKPVKQPVKKETKKVKKEVGANGIIKRNSASHISRNWK